MVSRQYWEPHGCKVQLEQLRTAAAKLGLLRATALESAHPQEWNVSIEKPYDHLEQIHLDIALDKPPSFGLFAGLGKRLESSRARQ